MDTATTDSSIHAGTRYRRALSSSEQPQSRDESPHGRSNHQSASQRNSVQQRSASKYGEIISALSNFSIRYNLGVIAPALLLLDHCRVSNQTFNLALYPRTASADSLLKSAVFIGAILGQCSWGFIGEAMCGSLNEAMMLTNCVALVGTLGCTFAPLVGSGDYHQADKVYTLLAVFRAILGFGVGGKYPLGSAIRAQAAESDTEHPDKRAHRAKEVAKGFFWQTPGAIMPYVVQLLLLLIIGDESSGVGRQFVASTNKQYMILVGLGALPIIATIVLSRREMASSSSIQDEPRGRCPFWQRPSTGSSTIRAAGNGLGIVSALQNKAHLDKLVGTGVSWALYDFVYYGTAFNQPELLAKVLGDDTGLVGISSRDALVAMMGIPGVVLAIQMMEEPLGGPKPLQGWGFVCIGMASLLMLCFYAFGDFIGPQLSKWGGFISCAILIFSLNWGCNVSTYVLPTEVFPKDVRSSMHGVSAGMGKAGALLGSVVFTQLNSINVSLTLTACIIACCLGVFVTWRFVEPHYQNTFFVGRPLRPEGRRTPIEQCNHRDTDVEK